MKIAFLNGYHFDGDPNSYQKSYAPMFLGYLEEIMPDDVFTEFNVTEGNLPPIEDFDGFIIGGSGKDCFADIPWIKALIGYIQTLHQYKKKILGICFGHQIVSQALGGNVGRHPGGWGVGVREFQIIKPQPWMTGLADNSQPSIKLLFTHRDQVLELPKGAERIATDDFCKNQMFCIDNHVLGMQGHPEFTKEFSKIRMDNQVDSLGDEVYRKGVQSLEQTTDHLLVGQWINTFFHQ